MSMSPQNARPVEDPADYGTDSDGQATRWFAEIKIAQDDFHDWLKQCREIEYRYRDKRLDAQKDEKRFAVLWSNIETLKPAVYARPPVPVVTRRYRDQDSVGRAAALILRRNIQHAIDVGEVHHLMKQVRDDYLLFARGVMWARYEPHFDTAERPSGTMDLGSEADDEGVQVTDDTESESEEVAWEEVEWDFVGRDDFLHSPARVWAEVRWVARRVRMTRAALKERFGNKVGGDIPLMWKPERGETEPDGTPIHEALKRAVVYEIWSMDDRTVYWVAEGYDALCDKKDDPLGLEGFFPCPRPLYGTLTNSSLVPIPDYKQYQDQASELDDLTGRIAAITQAIKVAGVYDSRFTEISRIFEEGLENQLIPVEQWGEFAQKGGLEGSLSLVPVDALVKTLQTLIEARAAVKADLYEITGIADIVRGSTAPEETATAQRIKGRYATLRLSDRQLEVARYVRDVLRLTGEIICKHFSPETMALASNFQESEIAQDSVPPQMGHNGGPPMQGMPGAMMAQPPALLDQAIALLKDDRLRSFRIDVEDQSTIAVDDEAEKASRVEFLTAVGGFLSQSVQMPPNLAPALTPMLGKLLMFGVRGFRVGADMEAALEDALGKVEQMVTQQAQNPAPNPEAQKAQAELQKTQMEMQKAQADMQFQAQQAEQDRALKQQEMQMNAAQAQAQNAQDATEHQLKIATMELEQQRLGLEQWKAEAEVQLQQEKLRLEAEKVRLDHEARMHEASLKRDQMAIGVASGDEDRRL